jgi:hypothetical protein
VKLDRPFGMAAARQAFPSAWIKPRGAIKVALSTAIFAAFTGLLVSFPFY